MFRKGLLAKPGGTYRASGRHVSKISCRGIFQKVTMSFRKHRNRFLGRPRPFPSGMTGQETIARPHGDSRERHAQGTAKGRHEGERSFNPLWV
ncbi:MAG TPA: hypothetical protein DDZ04_00260 [Parabacteroides sp.]|nr:hypothetical protein [Parabacteroides sp.]